MPELPEVEVLRRSLETVLVGRTIRKVTVRQPALREKICVSALRVAVTGRAITGLRRRAKYLLIDLGADWTLVVHLGMSGRFQVVPSEAGTGDHLHLWFDLNGGLQLRYYDPRRFGLVFASRAADLNSDRRFSHLGVEPLDSNFSGEALKRRAIGRRSPVKSFLMDGRVVVGVGNIYASESLWRAGVHPMRSVARISERRWDLLARAVIATLRSAIQDGGSTLNDFADGQGREGLFQTRFVVYGRKDCLCPRCGAEIRRAIQSGRSTYYCPGCQR